MSVDCPLDCEYLREAHKHEKPLPLDTDALPNRDLMVDEEVLGDNEEFLSFLAKALGRAARSNPQVVDFDIREALEASIRTHRTLQSGLLYESLPANPLAAGIVPGATRGDLGIPPERKPNGLASIRLATVTTCGDCWCSCSITSALSTTAGVGDALSSMLSWVFIRMNPKRNRPANPPR